MLEQLNGYDWEEAFKYAGFERSEVARILHIKEGENDTQSWMLCGERHDGKFFYLEAWCDYTGWG